MGKKRFKDIYSKTTENIEWMNEWKSTKIWKKERMKIGYVRGRNERKREELCANQWKSND